MSLYILIFFGAPNWPLIVLLSLESKLSRQEGAAFGKACSIMEVKARSQNGPKSGRSQLSKQFGLMQGGNFEVKESRRSAW